MGRKKQRQQDNYWDEEFQQDLAEDGNDEAPEVEEKPSSNKKTSKAAKNKNKKQQKKTDEDYDQELENGEEEEVEEEVKKPTKTQKKTAKASKGKNKKQQQEEEEEDEVVEEEEEEPVKTSKKKKAKASKKKRQEEEEEEEPQEEIEPTPEPEEGEGEDDSTSQSKKKKKKKKSQKKKSEEVDQEQQNEEAEAEVAATVVEPEPEQSQNDENEEKGEEVDNEDGTTSQAAKKKKKKKKKKAATTTTTTTEETANKEQEDTKKVSATEAAAEEEEEVAKGAKKKGKKKGALPTKLGKQLAKLLAEKQAEEKRIQEEMERQRLIEEEEERKREEEEARLAEIKEKQKAERKAQAAVRAKKKAEQDAERRKKEVIAQLQAQGMIIPNVSGDSKPKRVTYGKKKKTPQQKQGENSPDTQEKVTEASPSNEKQATSPQPQVKEQENKEQTKTPVESTKVEEKKPEEKQEEKPVEEKPVEEEEDEDVDEDWEAADVNKIIERVKESWEEEEEDEEEKEKARQKKAAEKAAKASPKETPKKEAPKKEAPKKEAPKKEAPKKETKASTKNNNNSKATPKNKASSNDEDKNLRSPICCILGHVDTGKTKLLDKIRHTNVQEGEAGGITQQIGATYFPLETIKNQTADLSKEWKLDFQIPGLLVIDTPGHESFANLRSRGSSLCDMSILVVDLMHGLEPQTIESIKLLKQKKIPFVVALNKVDRLYEWKTCPNTPIRKALEQQSKTVIQEFNQRVKQTIAAFAAQHLNAVLYYENPDYRSNVSLVPTSAVTGEGVPDLLSLIVQLTQKMMSKKLLYVSELQCTVLEVKVVEGLGTTIDVILVNGELHEGDKIVLCGLSGPIVTHIRALLTPEPCREMRVKSAYQHHKTIKAAQGIKIVASDLEKAVAGSQLFVVEDDDDLDEIEEAVMADLQSFLSMCDKSGIGVSVQASTLGSLEALLVFLKDCKIPVFNVNIGPIHQKDVKRASIMLEKKKSFAVILAFDVKIEKEAELLADELGVKIFKADIIYHLFDKFTAYMETMKKEEQQEVADVAIFPAIVKIVPNRIFCKRKPLLLGLEVTDGVLKIGTPLCVPGKGMMGQPLDLGKVIGIEANGKSQDQAKKGEEVAVKIDAPEINVTYGRQFDLKDMIVSKISRASIDALKVHFKEELEASVELRETIVKLKKVLDVV